MRVTVQQNIDVVRRLIGRNVLQTEFQPAAHEIDYQRPFEIAVTISAHDRDARPDGAQFIENGFRANIAKVPDFIRMFGHFFDILRQTIVRVRKHKNPQALFGFLLQVNPYLNLLTP